MISRIIKISAADLQKAIQKAYTPKPVVAVVKQVHDFKQWMEPHVPPMHGHLKAHAFKFVKKGVTLMYYKEWACDRQWLPKSGLAILMMDKSMTWMCPRTIPKLVKPNFDSSNLDKLECTMTRISAYLKEGAKYWWEDWIANTRRENVQQQPLTEQEGKTQHIKCLPIM